MKEAGFIVVNDPGSDRPILEVSTLQCVHCQRHWVPRPGSGILRGHCFRCNGPICGPSCVECVPALQMIENIEKGRPENFVPIIVPSGWEA